MWRNNVVTNTLERVGGVVCVVWVGTIETWDIERVRLALSQGCEHAEGKEVTYAKPCIVAEYA